MALMPLMIDSGAYSAWSHGKEIDINAYIEFCHAIKADYPQAVFVNLDVIDNGEASYANWLYLKKKGVEALPIYHVTTPTKYLERYLAETDHIGLGAIASMSNARRSEALDRVWEKYLVDRKTRMPTAKVHGMGITSFPLMKRYPWHSIDSTSWLHIAMYGHVALPRRRGGKWDYSAPPIKIGFSTQCGDRKVRGKHWSNVSPEVRELFSQYLSEKGFTLGFEAKGEDGEMLILRGVATWHGARSDLCLDFFASYLASLPWPRPFNVHRTKGLGIV